MSGTATSTRISKSQESPKQAGPSICAFWIGERCYGLGTDLVGEVLVVESVTPVPLVPPAVIGMFSLRGVPVALVSLAEILELDERRAKSPAAKNAIVLRSSAIICAAVIDKMELVVPAGEGRFSAPNAQDEHPAVRGFVSLEDRGGLIVTVLDSQAVLERIDRIKYRR